MREQSPILVNILLNHKACNHVQNLNKETPLLLALNLYIEYRNLKDYASVQNSSSELNSAQINNGYVVVKLNNNNNEDIASTKIAGNTTQEQPIQVVNGCFCQKKEKSSFDQLQLKETNNNLKNVNTIKDIFE